jgi:DNA-binding CsgD family transcriptional regulator
LSLAQLNYSQGQFAQAHALRLEALALARQHADGWAFFKSAWALVAFDDAPQYWEERVRLAEECAGWPSPKVNGLTLGLTLWSCGLLLLAEGNRARTEDLWRQVEEVAERTRVALVSLQVLRRDVILAILDGQLEEALAQVKRYVERAKELGSPVLGRHNGLLTLISPAAYLGRADLWLTAFDEHARAARLDHPGRPVPYFIDLTAARATFLAQLGRVEEARTLAGALLDEVARGSGKNETPINTLALLLQAAVVLKHREAAQVLAGRLACVSHLAVGDRFHTCVGRHLGDAATLTGNRPRAREHYLQALEATGKIRFRPEQALTHLSMAALLLEETDEDARSDALDHLEIAIPELRDMKMQPALERALALKDKFETAVAQRPGRRSASDTLTAREREIASLMSDGLSNHDIAERLVISEGTVEVHVKHILGKLGFRSRAQVAGWVARQGPG